MDYSPPYAATTEGEHRGAGDALASGSGSRTAVGRYLLMKRLGTGGMGVVYLAYDPKLSRRVAIKLLRTELGTGTLEEKSTLYDRLTADLMAEARALARLSHPNVLGIYDMGRAEDGIYLATELVDGKSLYERLHPSSSDAARALPWREALTLMLDAGEGLAAAHRAGLVHRDIKPGNIMIDRAGVVKILDFGLAGAHADGPISGFATGARENASAPDNLSPRLSSPTATQSSGPGAPVGVGTPGYMPLEQWRGGEVDARADQFAYCVTLFELLYGRQPFMGLSSATVQATLERGPELAGLSKRGVPATLRAIVLRGLELQPCERYASMDELLAELRSWLEQFDRQRRLGWAMTCLGVAVAGMVIATPQRPQRVECASDYARELAPWRERDARQIEHAFSQSAQPSARAKAQKVAERMGALNDEWISTHAEVCEQLDDERRELGLERAEQRFELRMTCLQSLREPMRSFIEVAKLATPEVVTNAISATAELAPPQRCTAAADATSGPPPPLDPRVAQAVETMRSAFREVRMLGRLGQVERANAQSLELVERADDLGYPPLRAEARYEAGLGFYEATKPPQARQWLRSAVEVAVESEHDEIASLAASLLAFVDGILIWTDHESREAQIGSARAFARRNPDNQAVQIELGLRVGPLISANGRRSEGLDLLMDATELLVDKVGLEDSRTVTALHDAAMELMPEGRLEESEKLLEQAELGARAIYGEEHNLFIYLYSSQSQIHQLLGRPREALDAARRAHAIVVHRTELELNLRGRLLGQLMTSLVDMGQCTAAQNLERNASQRWPALGDPCSAPFLCVKLIACDMQQGHNDDALSKLERLRKISEDGPDFGLMMAPHDLWQFARRAFVLGHNADAERWASAAEHSRLQSVGDLGALGEIQREVYLATRASKRGQPMRALEHYAEALAAASRGFGPQYPERRHIHLAQARLALELELFDRARDDLDKARKITERGFGREHHFMAAVELLSAKHYALRGDESRARVALEAGSRWVHPDEVDVVLRADVQALERWLK